MDTALHAETHTGAAPASALAYSELKSWILHGRVPVATPLREGRLAERLGCSRTPAREALVRLCAERFLERHPHGGYCVAPPRVQTARDLYELRRALELFALRRGAEQGHDEAGLERLRADWTALAGRAASTEFVLIDEAFHVGLAEAAGNARLGEELHRINELIRPVRTHDFLDDARIATTIEQHLAILDALLAGRAREAGERLDAHILESQAEVEVRVARALERMLDFQDGDEPW